MRGSLEGNQCVKPTLRLPSNIYQQLQEGRINWSRLAMDYILDEEFIITHCNQLNWIGISVYQTLSTQFMTAYATKID